MVYINYGAPSCWNTMDVLNRSCYERILTIKEAGQTVDPDSGLLCRGISLNGIKCV